jgi:CheY-like chemotaxis protein
LGALHRYAILDTAPDREFDELVERAATECGYPTAMLSLIDEHRCWFKSATGVLPADRGVREIPRNQTICNFAFRSSGIIVVPDASADERFKSMPIVDRPGGYRAYVGTPLITPDGHSIGTLCLLDTVPRTPSPSQTDKLRALGTRVMALLESRQRDLAPAPSISITATPATGRPIQMAPPTVATGVNRQLVLVVDDEELVRGVTAAMVARLGCETRMAANGQEALDRIASLGGRVDVVITDVNMPVLDGVRLARTLRNWPDAPAIIAMSGKFTPEIRKELMSEGVTEFVVKPFGVEDMTNALRAALASRR